MKRIGIVTTSRADYGILRKMISLVHNDSDLELKLFVTGTHLSSDYGLTVNNIVEDGFPITERIEIPLDSTSASSISKSIGLTSISFGETLPKHNLDILLVLGDRYELLPICSTALIFKIPLAHISGGETTEGAIDEAVRHSITKMSYLHFPACETYRRRIIQLGENPKRVFNFGDVGVEAIINTTFYSIEEISTMLNFNTNTNYAIVVFHPTTLDDGEPTIQIKELLDALAVVQNINYIFIKSNSDMHSNIINQEIDEFVKEHSNSKVFKSLNSRLFLSTLKYATFIIGNSSSGIVEAPALKVPTINIGDRQKGRLQAESIINCSSEKNEILQSISKAISLTFNFSDKNLSTPYQSNNTSINIIKTIKDFLFNEKIDLKKEFYDVEFEVLK